ncbi:MAG: acyl-CoA thioesterase [Firmicutes bacterium]|nr:acyl-CoA thioesterase [Bacillota bacterium]
MEPKSWRESYTEHKEIVVPPHCNHHGTVFGGHILSLIDQVAGVAAMEHCGSPSVVTLSMDRVHFFRPVKEGQMLHLQARVTFTGQSSLEVHVKVYGKDLADPERAPWLTCEAFTTFVLVDETGRPVKKVPPLLLETEEDRALFEAARMRREARLAEARRRRLSG